jgi:DNA-binding protein HU-beta
MNTSEFAAKLSDKTLLPRAHAAKVLSQVVDILCAEIAAGEKVSLSGLGAFKMVERAPRKARNPLTGAEVDVPAKKVVKFTPAKRFREELAV